MEKYKALLVLDNMPLFCYKCKFSTCVNKDNQEAFCNIKNKWYRVEKTERFTKPKWCPLIYLPEEEDDYDDRHWDQYDTGYVDGWNQCIDTIEREDMEKRKISN